MGKMKEKTKEVKEKILWQWKVMEYLSYAIVFITPLFFIDNHHLFSFSSPKTILIIGLVSFIIIFYSWGKIVENKIFLRFTPLHLISIIFLFVITLSSVLGIDPHNSFFGRWIESISLILVYAVTIFAFLIGFLVKKNKLFISRILLVSFISSIFVALITYDSNSAIEIFSRGSTTLSNDSYTGAYLFFNVCFGVGLFFYYSKNWKKILTTLGILVVILSPIFFNEDIFLGKIKYSEIIHNPLMLLGEANASILGLAISFLVIISFFLIFSSKKISKIIGLILLLSVLSGILYAGFLLVKPTSQLHRIYTEQKGENRFIAWNVAKKSFFDRPLLGSGFNNYSYNYQKYFTSNILKSKSPEFYFNQPHNIIWEYASNTGVIGLISFLALLLFAFYSLFINKQNEEKKHRNIKIVLIGSLFGYFIQNLFGFDTPINYLMLFLVIGIAVGESSKEWLFIISDKHKKWFKIISGFIIIFSLTSMILFVILPSKELRIWGKLISTNNVKDRISLRNKMQDISLLGGAYDSAYVAEKFFDLYKKDINNINDSNKILYLEEIKSIINQVEKDIKRQPYEIRAYLISSQLLNMQIFIEGKVEENIWEQSYNNTKKALKLNPENPEIYLLLAQTYLLKEDLSNAYSSVRQAISIAPEYVPSYEYAKKILKIKPDENFQGYIDSMESRWINQIANN